MAGWSAAWTESEAAMAHRGGQTSRTCVVIVLLASLLWGCDLLDEGPAGARPVGDAATPTVATAATSRALVTPTAPPNRASSALSPTPRGTASAVASGTPAGTPTSTPATTPTPRPAASGYRRHISTLYPYAIDYLETWRNTSGGATFDGVKADLFAGDRRGAVTNSVTVLAQPVADGTTSQLFLEASLGEITNAGLTPQSEVERTIEGYDAYVFSYTLTNDNQAYAITQAVFVRQGYGWVLTLTAAPDDQARLAPVFSHMLDSFQAWG